MPWGFGWLPESLSSAATSLSEVGERRELWERGVSVKFLWVVGYYQH